MASYTVIGDKAVKGKTKGETVSIDDPAAARALQRGGHISRDKPKKKKTSKKAEG